MPARRQSVSVLEAGEKTLADHQPQSPLAMTGGGRRKSGQNSPETYRPSSKLPFPVRRLSCGNSQDGFTALVQQTHALSHSATPTFQPPRGEFQQSPLVPKLFTFCCRTVSRRPRRQPSLPTLCRTRNPTSKPAVRTALNVHGSNNRAWVPVERYRFTRTGTLSSTWARLYMPAPWPQKRMRYRSPGNCRKTATPGTAV